MGGIVEVADGQIEGDRLMDVQWEGRTVMMFAQDLRARGEELESPVRRRMRLLKFRAGGPGPP